MVFSQEVSLNRLHKKWYKSGDHLVISQKVSLKKLQCFDDRQNSYKLVGTWVDIVQLHRLDSYRGVVWTHGVKSSGLVLSLALKLIVNRAVLRRCYNN